MRDTIAEMTNANPVYDIHAGCPSDLYDIIDSGEFGIRAAFYGHEWATVRDALVPAVEIYVDEFNAQIEAME